jgi:hypothetical protein
MKQFVIGVLSLAVLITPAFAIASPPVELTDAEMDNVTAGALLEVTVRNIDVNVEDNEIIKNVDVVAAVTAAVNVLGNQAAGAAAKITK